jgi:serine carboxypeptidase-like clade 1
MGIISEEFYHSLVRSCGGEYMNVDPNNVECVNNIIAWEEKQLSPETET